LSYLRLRLERIEMRIPLLPAWKNSRFRSMRLNRGAAPGRPLPNGHFSTNARAGPPRFWREFALFWHADEEAIAFRFQEATTELVNLTRELIDADEALAAEPEAMSIAEELAKDLPDESIITREKNGFVNRLALTFSSAADLASKGEMIGEFGERLAAWLVALSIWTEWHTAHHVVVDPCA
jgi:hypothetical protein